MFAKLSFGKLYLGLQLFFARLLLGVKISNNPKLNEIGRFCDEINFFSG